MFYHTIVRSKLRISHLFRRCFSRSMMSAQRFPSVVAYTDTIASNGSFEAMFEKRFPTASLLVLDSNTPPDVEQLSEAEVLITDPVNTLNLIGHAKKLKWLHLPFAGYDDFVKYLQKTRKVPTYRITRQGATFGPAMAEYVIAHIVAHERRFIAIRDDQKSKQWRHLQFSDYRPLPSLTIGLVGAGDIGCEIAKTCKSFGMRTIGLVTRARSEEERSEFIDDYRLTEELDYLLSESDVICNILPSCPDTVEFYKGDTFKCCSKKPLFINVGRGDAVKDSTIVKSIQNGWLSGAVLDVTNPEPLPQESPLWDIPQVTITPHVSCMVQERVAVQLFLRNYDKYIRGEPMEYELDVNKLC